MHNPVSELNITRSKDQEITLSRGRHACGKSLVLQTHRDENVAQPIDRSGAKKVGREIDGEFPRVALKLMNQRVSIERRNDSHQLFHLVRPKHKNLTR